MTTSTDSSALSTLIFCLAQRSFYRSPLFSTKETFCSPDENDRTEGDRPVVARTPLGFFDVGDFIRGVPGLEKPDLLVVKADATLRNCPKNLFKLKCPKVLIVGDTHHLKDPLQRVIRYALEEPFTHIVFDHTRHHAHFFMEAGLKNVHWIPAVDFAFNPREPKAKPSRPLSFVGQVGIHHPYRSEIMMGLRQAGLPLEILRGTTQEAADIYADSQVTLNVSLNGDLNLRVFEALAASGFLLTERLSPASGLPLLFEDGKHLAYWSSLGELKEKIAHYLAHPEEADSIRRAGHAEMLLNHSPEVKIRELFDLVFSNKVNPRYELADERARSVKGFGRQNFPDFAQNRLRPYEHIQELHRVNSAVTVFCEDPARLQPLCDLPRLRCRGLAEDLPPAAPGEVELLWLDRTPADLVPLLTSRLISSILVDTPTPELGASLERWGYSQSPSQPGVFRLENYHPLFMQALEADKADFVITHLQASVANATSANDCLALGDLAERAEMHPLYAASVERAVALDRSNVAALTTMIAASLDQSAPETTLILLEELARLDAIPEQARELYEKLRAEHAESTPVKVYRDFSGTAPVLPAEKPRRVLVVTNIFPPQELGGYGRKMFEFSRHLSIRGHSVRVLSADLPTLAKAPSNEESALEPSVSRTLKLLGSWQKGRPVALEDPVRIMDIDEHNQRTLNEAMDEFRPDIVFAGNLDFLGVGILNTALGRGLPVLQALGNPMPGYATHEQPFSPAYWIGSCSHWNAAKVQSLGYMPGKVEVIYPGARVDRFFHVMLPDRRRLRICFAGLVMPFKGAHTLIEAVAALHLQHVDFTVEIAGETTNPDFVADLKRLAEAQGFADRLYFTGFLDRAGLSNLFARNNVLVFPSIVEEGFGISQVEALAAGLVVVSSGTGGAKEIIRDGIDGLLFQPNNPNSLAEQLLRLARDPALFEALQAGSQRRAMEFSVHHTVLKIERLFEELIQVAGPAPSPL